MLTGGAASADPWKDESGKGRWRGGDYGWGEPERKFKFRSADGCEVERKWKKGEYEEKRSAEAWLHAGSLPQGRRPRQLLLIRFPRSR